MNISHVISSIDLDAGGPSRSSTSLLKSLNKINNDINISLHTFNSKSPILRKFDDNRLNIFFYDKNKFGFAKKFSKKLLSNDYDLIHGHGIWDPILYQMYLNAKSPFVISTRGMMEPWSLSQKRIKKKVFRTIITNRILSSSFCLHATALSEAKNLRKLGFMNPIAIIPNGINLSEFSPTKKMSSNVKKILFMSRIHQKKGIENLISAFSLLNNDLMSNWIIEIVGNGQKDYINSLNSKIFNLGLSTSIKIKDPVYGYEKYNLLKSADVFVLPSYSENFGIVIAESLASGVPVITTKGTPWEELLKYNCGDWIETGVNPLVNSLNKMLKLNEGERIIMGQNGRKLIEEKYTSDKVSVQMLNLYEWILGFKTKPNFIY